MNHAHPHLQTYGGANTFGGGYPVDTYFEHQLVAPAHQQSGQQAPNQGPAGFYNTYSPGSFEGYNMGGPQAFMANSGANMAMGVNSGHMVYNGGYSEERLHPLQMLGARFGPDVVNGEWYKEELKEPLLKAASKTSPRVSKSSPTTLKSESDRLNAFNFTSCDNGRNKVAVESRSGELDQPGEPNLPPHVAPGLEDLEADSEALVNPSGGHLHPFNAGNMYGGGVATPWGYGLNCPPYMYETEQQQHQQRHHQHQGGHGQVEVSAVSGTTANPSLNFMSQSGNINAFPWWQTRVQQDHGPTHLQPNMSSMSWTPMEEQQQQQQQRFGRINEKPATALSSPSPSGNTFSSMYYPAMVEAPNADLLPPGANTQQSSPASATITTASPAAAAASTPTPPTAAPAAGGGRGRKRGPGRPRAKQAADEGDKTKNSGNGTVATNSKKRYTCEICQKRFSTAWYVRVHRKSHNGERPYICHNCGKGFMLPNVLQVHLRKCEKNAAAGKLPRQPNKTKSNTPSTTESARVKNSAPSSMVVSPKTSASASPSSSTPIFEAHDSMAMYSPSFSPSNRFGNSNSNSNNNNNTLANNSGQSNNVCYANERPAMAAFDSSALSTSSGHNSNKSNNSFGYNTFNAEFAPTSTSSTASNADLESADPLEGRFLAADRPRDKGGTSIEGCESRGRSHACEVCDRRFSQKCNLVTHMRLHTGERPYACNVCDRRFTQKGNLDAHLRTHAKERATEHAKNDVEELNHGLPVNLLNIPTPQSSVESNLESSSTPFRMNSCMLATNELSPATPLSASVNSSDSTETLFDNRQVSNTKTVNGLVLLPS